MPNLTPQQLKGLWDCVPVANRVAYELIRAGSLVQPYLVPEQGVKDAYAAAYGTGWQEAYRAWFQMSALQIVSRTVAGTTYTGIDCLVGAAPLVQQCKIIGGCGSADPCDCNEFFWLNKPNNPCG